MREQWRIYNGNGEPEFIGSLAECEDWLDRSEHLLSAVSMRWFLKEILVCYR
jgi:hypothetical protein